MRLQNILLVEDHPADAQRMVRALVGISAEIIHTQTLKETMTVLRERAGMQATGIDVVLLDLGLPDTVGMDGIRRIRRLAPQIPCIVMTGMEEDCGPAALHEGAEDFLSKAEINPRMLARAIRYAIERNKRLQAVRETEASLRRVVETHPDAMLVVSADNLIKLANPAAATLLGRSARRLIGSRPPFPLEEGTPTILELSGIGGARTVEIVTARTTWKGEAAWLAAVRDVSYRKREERLRRQLQHAERLAVLGQFAAGVAHEVNNPATVLMTNIQLLRMELPSLKAALHHDPELVGALQESEDMLTESLNGITRITQLTRSLQGFLEASQSEAGQVDLTDLIQNVCAMSRHQINAVAELKLDIGELPSVIASRDALSQALLNLVRNATQAIPAGNPCKNAITISAKQSGGMITIAVADTGAGIPGVLRDRIFEPFYTTRPPGDGTGLGLPLARDILRRHGGDLRLASEPGAPTRFELLLPTDTQLNTRPPPTQTAQATARAGRVLLIDDEPMVRRTLSQQLLRSGLETAVASDGLEALEILGRDTRFDVILCDMMMPELDGCGFYEALRTQHPALTQRVLFYSGATLPDHLHAFQATVDRPVLRKPLSRLKLLNAVQELMRKRGAAEE
ncbi:MAG: signal transduction histidine kinase [Myxococcota bacterium]|jgi:signal transduction histidine kinase